MSPSIVMLGERTAERWGCLAFAVTATVLSLLITGTQAWSKGGPAGWQWLWTAFGVFTVLVVHGLLAVSLPRHWIQKSVVLLTWLTCSCFVVSGHIGFFLSFQEAAGTQRAEAIKPDGAVPTPLRALSQIRNDQAGVTRALFKLEVTDCGEDCARHRIQVAHLKGRAKVLEAEEDEYLRWQAAQDRYHARRDRAEQDPVMTRLADSLGVPGDRISLMMGLLFTMVLEGVGCVCWIMFLQRRDSRPAVENLQVVTKDVTSSVVEVTSEISTCPKKGAPLDLEGLTARTKLEIDAGRIRPTVEEIRLFLKCSQTKARAVRAAIVAV